LECLFVVGVDQLRVVRRDDPGIRTGRSVVAARTATEHRRPGQRAHQEEDSGEISHMHGLLIQKMKVDCNKIRAGEILNENGVAV
jgi:hypothetical protein